ncbi:MAG: hypothetical protein LRY73_18400 [Bacillus sp. (in: Bacteria)]|nr:hypothetical protein [Bacillus sp. (in: firmicutes)]
MSKWTVEEIKVLEKAIEAVVTAEETADYIKKLIPAGQILVDSNELSFVYILEDENALVHLRLPEQLWEELNSLRKKELPVQAVFVTKTENVIIELENFHNELNNLIENIQGNANYGENMVHAVETSFR